MSVPPDEPPDLSTGGSTSIDASVPVVDAALPDGLGPDAADTSPGEPACSGFALSLDGSNYASIPRVVQNDFTLEAWIRTTASITTTNAYLGVAVLEADVIGMGEQNDFVTGVIDEHYAFGIGNPDTTLEGSTVVTTGEWVHVAVTRDADTGVLQLIVDGVLDGSVTGPNRNPLSAPVTIDIGGSVIARRFVGLIDEVRIWNVVRSVDAIASTLRARLTGSEPGLVAYYPFEDRALGQTSDLSPPAQPATLMGTASYALSTALCP